jgi:hypothetical protein
MTKGINESKVTLPGLEHEIAVPTPLTSPFQGTCLPAIGGCRIQGKPASRTRSGEPSAERK